jgi:uncharacterized protein YjiK
MKYIEKIILTSFASLAAIAQLQAVVLPGDIAFVGVNATNPDQFAILAKNAITAGDTFIVTDGGVTGVSGIVTTFFRTTEGFLQYTAPAGGIAAGSVLVFNAGDGGAPSVSRNGGGAAGSVTLLNNTASNTISFTFSSSGDSLTAYTFSGGTYLTGTPTPLAFIGCGVSPYAGSPQSSSTPAISGGQVLVLANFDNAIFTNAANAYSQSIAALSTAVNFSARDTTAYDLTTLTSAPILPAVNLSVSASSGTEAGATVITVTATASAAVTGDQTVALAVTGAGITAGDYTLSNATITILGGQTNGTVTFTVFNDGDVEGTETATLTISSPSAGITLGATTARNVAITDDDVPAVNLSVSANAGTETGVTAITVTATSSPAVSGDQTVSLAVNGTGLTAGDYTLSNATIIILNGQTTGTVTFTVVDDATYEGEETAVLTISSPSSGIALGATTMQNVVITDNDPVPPPGPTAVDLSRYVRVGRYDLPEPTRTTAPANSLLCQEASNVTYNWDTDTLFITGDGGTSVVQVSKTGQLINSMSMALGNSPQGTEFYDTEGLTYVGNGQFVLVEERDRQACLFTYAAGTTLQRSNVQTVKLGTTVGNVGLEGLCYDPSTSGFIFVKEKSPISIFQTTINFPGGTASNGSPSATSSTDLFNPALANLADFSDVFALSNLPSLNGQPDASHLLIISQESGQIKKVDRSGTVFSTLTIVADPGSPLTVPDMTMEGVTMDRAGNLYVSNEGGGGVTNHPQLWVYAPSTSPNAAPTAVALLNQVAAIPENASTAAVVKVADISITDDGLGNNNLSVTGADADSFQIIGIALYLKAGTSLAVGNTYQVTVNVDDTTLGNTPDASVNYVLTVTADTGGTPNIIISEVAPWSSGNGSLGSDWFEITNIGTAAQNIVGWKMDDSSNSSGSAATLNGITSIAPGESVIFIESASSKKAQFLTLWFGANPPANLQVGNYSGSGIGLSTDGDQVNLFDNTNVKRAGVNFGAATTASPLKTFDNAAGVTSNGSLTLLSATGVNGAFSITDGAFTATGSPGAIGAPPTPLVTITATDASAAETASNPGTFRISRTGGTVGAMTVNYTIASGAGRAVGADFTPALGGVATIAFGQSFVDLTVTPVDDNLVEGTETLTLTLGDTGSYDVGSPASATVSIADNDFSPSLQAGILVTRGGFVFDRRTGFFSQVDKLTNNSASPIAGPIYLVLDSLSANATLSGPTGFTTAVPPLGSPYVQVVGPTASLAPGASVSTPLNFINPTRAAITYVTRVLSGGTAGAVAAEPGTTGPPLTVFGRSSVRPVDAWRQLHFNTVENGGLTADDADFDGDGVLNLMEYALGSNPTLTSGNHGQAALPTGVLGDSSSALLSDRFVLSFTIDSPAPSYLTYTVEASADLENWTPVAESTGDSTWNWLAGGTSHIVVGTPSAGRVTIKVGDMVPQAGNPKRVMRLKVSK